MIKFSYNMLVNKPKEEIEKLFQQERKEFRIVEYTNQEQDECIVITYNLIDEYNKIIVLKKDYLDCIFIDNSLYYVWCSDEDMNTLSKPLVELESIQKALIKESLDTEIEFLKANINDYNNLLEIEQSLLKLQAIFNTLQKINLEIKKVWGDEKNGIKG